jgi:hypothetical protein
MAYPDDLPTRVDGSLGRTKQNARAVEDLDIETPAEEFNILADSVEGLCAALGLPDGSTSGSIYEILDGLPAGNLVDAISSGALANPTTLTVNGAIDTDSQIVFIFSGVYAGLPVQTEAGAIFLYAVGPCALVPYLYPAGSQTINGVLDTPHSLTASGLYILTRDGAGAWGATSCGDVFNDLTGTNAAPDANVDSTLGYAAKSIRIDTSGAIWMCTSASAAAAVWECISHGQSLGTVSAASGTLGVHSITQVTHAAALCALTLPASQATWPIGVTRRVRKSNTSAFGITLAPNAGGTVQGLAADATFTLPNSTIASSTTTSDMVWEVTRDGASTWRVSSASPVAAASTATYFAATSDGAVATPAFRLPGTGNGIHGHATDGLVFDVDSVERARFKQDGTTEFGSTFGASVPLFRFFNGSVTVAVFAGSGDPESVITGSIGDIYIRKGATGRLYVKETGSVTATGWVERAGVTVATALANGLMSAAMVTSHEQFKLGAPASTVQTIASGTTGTVAATDRVVLIATGSGAFTLTMRAYNDGDEILIVKTSTDANGITLARPGGAGTFNGASANLVLVGSTSTVGYIMWLYRVVGASAAVVG